MPRLYRRLITVLLYALLPAPLSAQTAVPNGMRPAQATVPVHVEMIRAPALSHAPGGARLLHELHITNLWEESLDVVSVEVRDAATQSVLRHYEDTLLLANMRVFQKQPDSLRAIRVAPGQRAILYLNVGVDTLHLPAALQFNVALSTVGRANNSMLNLRTAALPVEPERPIVIGAPLQGGPWAVFLGPDTMRTDPHNRMLVSVNARIAGPQRFAIDLVKFGTDGRLWRNSIGNNQNWPTFGANLIAVADGIVIEAVDTLPDNTPPDYERGAANRLVLDIGNGRYAAYAHLKQGSLKVRAGARVRRGSVLARVGNSGNSTGPHLHFQITNAPSALAAEGVPYVFERYHLLGTLAESAEDYEHGAVWFGGAGQPAQRTLPDNAQVLMFD